MNTFASTYTKTTTFEACKTVDFNRSAQVLNHNIDPRFNIRPQTLNCVVLRVVEKIGKAGMEFTRIPIAYTSSMSQAQAIADALSK